jgi:hypothetical protein
VSRDAIDRHREATLTCNGRDDPQPRPGPLQDRALFDVQLDVGGRRRESVAQRNAHEQAGWAVQSLAK